MDLYFQAWSKYATFSGRATRSEFWIFLLTNFVIQIILSIIGVTIGLHSEDGKTILNVLYTLAVLLPSFAVMVRRLHDINMSGWWGWLFIPFGLPILIVGFIESKEENKQDEKVGASSVIGAVINHGKDAVNKVKPAVADYVEKHQTANQQTSETQSTLNTFATEDDKMYEVAMKEIETDTIQKGIWAKAFSQSEGDKDKTEALYIKFRVQSMVAEENAKVQKEAEDRIDSETELVGEIKTEKNIKHKAIKWIYVIPLLLVALAIMAIVILEIIEYIKVEPFKKACDGGDAEKCFELGSIYRSGDGVKRDSIKGVEFLGKACDGGYAPSCKTLGEIYWLGLAGKKDSFKAVELLKKACDGGEAGGCATLSYMYDNGEGVNQDYFKAAELLKKACDGGEAESCNILGVRYSEGKGVKQDYVQAAELFKKACDGGHAWGCKNLLGM